MRARTEAKYVGGLCLAVASCLWVGQLAWAQAPAASTAITEQEASILGLQPEGKIPPQRIQETYRKILLDWSAGQTDRAPDELIELETAVVVDGEIGTRKTLLKAEQAVIHQVGAADLEVLVPIAVLHHQAYRRLLERGWRGEAMAMVHTRTMARDLAVLYHQQSGSEGAALVSSRLLTSLGGLLLQTSQQLPAAEMFQQAIELDGRNTAALIGLAAVYEKNAQAESAVKLLRRAVEVDPGNAEGKLRLALNLKRVDQRDEARKLLEGLTAVGESTWVTPLAFQELARLYSDQEKAAEAEKVLRQALKRFPDDARLTIQLAAVLDRRGEAREATALVETLLAASSSTREAASSRYLYNTVRPEAFAEARSFLDENSRSRLPVLSQALNAPADAGGTGVGR
ncbi:MAG TPA: tetratricopeptide repeat protein [Thermoanaerobaculia bacterium]|jgi:tetratricopeptide (TPR) repeat protein|nr:tetratricopeptide repeat protein [Thermoanaerobaculia bacterium]